MSSELQHKLSHFEAMPSANVWDSIAAQLDGEASGFTHRLHNFSEQPPQGVWSRIEAALDTEEKPAEVIPFYKKHSKLLRFGSMAAAILIAVIVLNLFGKKAETGTGTQSQTASVLPLDSGKASTQKPTIASKEILPGESNAPSDNPRAIASAKTSSNRYMTMAKDDGKTVRLSKKIYPVIDCAEKTEESTWSRCKENIQALQAKMSASVGAGDFGGLMDMIKHLEENE